MGLWLHSVILLMMPLFFFCASSKGKLQTFSVKEEPLYKLMGKQINDLWSRMLNKEIGSQNSFIGRCFGVARRLKFAMPIVLIKLGVIVTVLGFLTIFALKSLGLLTFLVVMSIAGAVSKIALWKNSLTSSQHQPPQNVHFHIHQSKNGQYEIAHSGYIPRDYDDAVGHFGGSPWSRGSSRDRLIDENSLEAKLKILKFYKELGVDPYDTHLLKNKR